MLRGTRPSLAAGLRRCLVKGRNGPHMPTSGQDQADTQSNPKRTQKLSHLRFGPPSNFFFGVGVPRRSFPTGPSGKTDAAHSKCAQTSANHPVPSYAPAHSGPCVHPRPSHSGLLGCGKWVWGPAIKWPAYAVRQKALAAQIQAFGSLFCAAHTTPAAKFSVGGSADTHMRQRLRHLLGGLGVGTWPAAGTA